MWPKFVLSLACLMLIIDLFASTTIPDIQYEQVIAERYLFEPFANESTAWTVLNNIHFVWQVAAALPQYHSQASESFWLLTQGQDTAALNLAWMSLSTNGTVIVLSEIEVNSNGSYLAVCHNENTAELYNAALISLDRVQLILCDPSDATSCRAVHTINFPSILMNTTKITAGLFVTDLGLNGWLYIASDSGLHGLDLSTFMIVPFISQINVAVSSLAWSSRRQTIFIGTMTKLWIQTYNNLSEEWRFEHVNGLIDSSITSLVYNDIQDKLWIGQDAGIALLSPIMMPTGRQHWFFSRLAGHISNPGSDIGHLPFANITTLSVSHSTSPDSRVWLGACRGVMRFDSNASNIDAWRVFNSARYMPNRQALVNVSSLTVLSRRHDAPANLGSAAVAVTSRGLAVIRFEMWTLAQKADYFQRFFDEPSRYVKYGLVCGCDMSSWGDIRTCVKGPCDSDGLWTSIHLAGQIFRYAITHDKQVKNETWKYFETLELLNQVTGILGYPARSVAKRTDFPSRGKWYPSPIFSDLQYDGDTSSDEIVAHEFIHPLVRDLLAENDDERQRAYVLLLNITTHILTHDWYLVGENHNRTTWGFWNPMELNNNSDYQEDRGLNSVQILAYLLQTYAYSGDERFLNGANLLVESYQYDVNMINQRMISICDGFFSDDELAYMSYFNLVYAFHTITSSTRLTSRQKIRAQSLIDHLLPYMQIGLDLSHKYKYREKTPFYNFIYCYSTNQVNKSGETVLKKDFMPLFNCDSLSSDGVWYLQRWPLELIDWPQFNSDRLDVQLNIPASECQNELQSLTFLPPDERSTKRWNSGVYNVDDGDGRSALDPSSFLISYWGMRYFDLLGA